MAEKYRVIKLNDRFNSRRPPDGTPQQELFDVAIMGIRDMNKLAQPFLRGFDVLNALRPIFPEIGANAIVDTQRLHRLRTDNSAFGKALFYVLTHGEERARSEIKDTSMLAEFDSAVRYTHYLQRNFKKPDTDFELNDLTRITPQELAVEWRKHMAQKSTKIISSDTDIKYGYRAEVKKPRPGIEIFSLDIGPLGHVINSNGILRVDWTAGAHRNNRIFDLRWGLNGLYPTDGFRATLIKGGDPLVFGIKESTISFPKVADRGSKNDAWGAGIKFPIQQEVMQDPPRYLELASRAMMQSIWHNLLLEMPPFCPQLNWRALREHYKNYPRQRLAFIDKIIDAFMVDPKKTFQLCAQLGILESSELFSGLGEADLRKILDILPERKEHFQNLILDPNGYSVFELLVSAMNEVIPKVRIDPKKDFMIFYEDIFPSGKN